MRTEILTITPEMAARWLAGKSKNRNLIRSVVVSYASSMRAGHWHLTHQGIAFDENGELVDGQHRLAAIVEAGISVIMMVTWGITRAVMQSAVDRNKKRTVAHSFAIDGEVNATVKSAVCRALWILETPSAGYTNEAPYELLRDMLAKYRTELDGVDTRINGTTSRVPAAVMAIGVIMMRGGLGQAFVDGLKSGAGLAVGDPRLLLRNWLLSGKKTLGLGSSATVEYFGRGTSAADAWINGESFSKLYASRQRYERWCKRVGLSVNNSLLAALS